MCHFISSELGFFCSTYSLDLPNSMAALKFKERGNECVRNGSKHYPDALGYYSLGILHSKDAGDSETASILYSNRAQVHIYLENYKRAFLDAETAIQLCSTNIKAYYRAVKASLALGLLDESKFLCDMGLEVSADNEDLIALAQEIDGRKSQQGMGQDQGSEDETASKVPWSKLPTDIVTLIAGRIHFAEDFIRFGMVCKPWRVALLKNKKNPCSLLPWVLLPEKEERDRRKFYCPFNERVYEIYLPEIRDARCWGSSSNWLVTLNRKHQIHLLDPLSRARILLPPLEKCPDFGNMFINPVTFRDDFVYKLIPSSDPLSDDCMVFAAFYFGKLNFAKPGDEGWGSLHYASQGNVEDVMYFGGKIYVILDSGEVVIGDSSRHYLKTLSIPTLVEAHECKEKVVMHMLEIGGQIFVIARHMHKPDYTIHPSTLSFKVHRLDTHTEKWEEINTLGDWSVFLGNNRTFAICGSDYPECTANCIYFTDDKYDLSGLLFNSQFPVPGSYDTGVYSFDDHTMRPLLQMEFSRVMYYCLPVWIKPLL